MRKKKVKRRLIEKQGVKKGKGQNLSNSGIGLTSFTLLQKQPLAVSFNLGQAYGKWSPHTATTFSALPIAARLVSTIKKLPPYSKCRESVLVDPSSVAPQPKRCCWLNDGPKNKSTRNRQHYLTTEKDPAATNIAINCSKTLKSRLFTLCLLYLMIVGYQITVISTSSFSSRERRQNFAQEYFVNSPIDHQTASFASPSSAKPARLDLLDRTTTTTSDGILIQTKQGIFRGKLIENVRSEVGYFNNRIGVSKNNSKHKVIGFLGKF